MNGTGKTTPRQRFDQQPLVRDSKRGSTLSANEPTPVPGWQIPDIGLNGRLRQQTPDLQASR